MSKFEFRLEKVLHYKQSLEEEAKVTYMEAIERRKLAERDLHKVIQHKFDVQSFDVHDLEFLRAKEAYLSRLEEEVESRRVILSVANAEEHKTQSLWLARRVDKGALEKLREHKMREWWLESQRLEQAGLDEWTTTRR
jgi:flagellar FliJ protein